MHEGLPRPTASRIALARIQQHTNIVEAIGWRSAKRLGSCLRHSANACARKSTLTYLYSRKTRSTRGDESEACLSLPRLEAAHVSQLGLLQNHIFAGDRQKQTARYLLPRQSRPANTSSITTQAKGRDARRLCYRDTTNHAECQDKRAEKRRGIQTKKLNPPARPPRVSQREDLFALTMEFFQLPVNEPRAVCFAATPTCHRFRRNISTTSMHRVDPPSPPPPPRARLPSSPLSPVKQQSSRR